MTLDGKITILIESHMTLVGVFLCGGLELYEGEPSRIQRKEKNCSVFYNRQKKSSQDPICEDVGNVNF